MTRAQLGHEPARPHLLVIAKAPIAGRCKTRLCPPCSPVQAAGLAQAALQDTLHAVAATPGVGRRVLVLDGPVGPWLLPGFEVVAQHGDGLAGRLAHAFAVARGPALLVGMDTPQLTPTLLQAGLRVLRAGAPSVLGLAADGGYWAIGLQRPEPAVFDRVPMSTLRTGAIQRSRLQALGLAPVALPVLRDVDRIADAIDVAAAAPATRFARALARLDLAAGDRAA
jgi:rSAM/selenodomain-associated transferase 1